MLEGLTCIEFIHLLARSHTIQRNRAEFSFSLIFQIQCIFIHVWAGQTFKRIAKMTSIFWSVVSCLFLYMGSIWLELLTYKMSRG